MPGLDWHYGPTADNPDPGRMWHRGCGGEVMFIEDRHVCMRCDRHDDPDPADLTAFLEAQWAEDERAALPFRNAQGRAKRWRCDETGGKVRQVGASEFGLPDVVSESDTHLTAEHIARHDPARVLADVAAKRAILAHLDLYGEDDHIARLLAAPFRGVPGWRNEWAIED